MRIYRIKGESLDVIHEENKIIKKKKLDMKISYFQSVREIYINKKFSYLDWGSIKYKISRRGALSTC